MGLGGSCQGVTWQICLHMFWLEAVGFEGPLPVLSSQLHSKLFMVSPHLGGLGTKMSMNLFKRITTLQKAMCSRELLTALFFSFGYRQENDSGSEIFLLKRTCLEGMSN